MAAAPPQSIPARDVHGVLEWDLFRSLICPLLGPRSLHACGLVQRSWSTAILSEHAVWERWCRALPPSPAPAAGLVGYAFFSMLRQVRCSRSIPLRLKHPDDGTVLELKTSADLAGNTLGAAGWTLGLKHEAAALLELGSNYDTMTTLFGRSPGALRDQLQAELAEVLLDPAWLREQGRVLPAHDYQVAAFPVRPVLRGAAEVFRGTGLTHFPRPVPDDGLGWSVVYHHALAARSTHCPTHLVLAPLHDVHDAAAVQRYESMIRDGHRPVVLTLCAGLPYNADLWSGMDIGGLTGYGWHDREIGNLRAVLARAEAEAAAGSERAQAAVTALRAELEEYAAEAPEQNAEEQANERRRALDCQSVQAPLDKFLRLGLCLVLDGHHKLRAAANLGAAVTVLCYGLQGTAITSHDVPTGANGDAANLYFDSEAIFEAVAS
jgi:hypothetical protein